MNIQKLHSLKRKWTSIIIVRQCDQMATQHSSSQVCTQYSGGLAAIAKEIYPTSRRINGYVTLSTTYATKVEMQIQMAFKKIIFLMLFK